MDLSSGYDKSSRLQNTRSLLLKFLFFYQWSCIMHTSCRLRAAFYMCYCVALLQPNHKPVMHYSSVVLNVFPHLSTTLRFIGIHTVSEQPSPFWAIGRIVQSGWKVDMQKQFPCWFGSLLQCVRMCIRFDYLISAGYYSHRCTGAPMLPADSNHSTFKMCFGQQLRLKTCSSSAGQVGVHCASYSVVQNLQNIW